MSLAPITVELAPTEVIALIEHVVFDGAIDDPEKAAARSGASKLIAAASRADLDVTQVKL